MSAIANRLRILTPPCLSSCIKGLSYAFDRASLAQPDRFDNHGK
jgi:hypothetical protein